MKLLRFDDDRVGVLLGEEVADVTDACPAHPDSGRLHMLIHTDGLAAVRAALPTAPRRPLAGVSIACPLPLPPKIVAAPVNYLDHKAEMAAVHTVADLGIFLKARTSAIGPGGVVRLPYSDMRIDQEGELGVVIGRRAAGLRPEEAMSAVFGYTCLLDMSLRSTEDRSTRKSFDTFTPIGPWIVTADEIADPARERMRCTVAGTVRQDTSIGDLIFDVPTLVAYASSIMTLEPGDVIATGTPAGVGPVRDGDQITVEIGRIGTLRVTVSAAGAVPYAERTGATAAPVAAKAIAMGAVSRG